MFTNAFEKILPNTYQHDYYEEHNQLVGITKESHIENMRCKLMISDKLVEELKNYESILFGYYFNSSIGHVLRKKKLWIGWLASTQNVCTVTNQGTNDDCNDILALI